MIGSQHETRLRGHAQHRVRGFVLPLVLVLITLAFAGWSLLQESTAGAIRQQQTRALREERARWASRAAAQALRALYARIVVPEELPSVLEWEETVTLGAESRVFTIHAARLQSERWEIEVLPFDESAGLLPGGSA